MSRLAVVEPKSLQGEAVREAVADHSEDFDQVDLFTTEEEEVGSVTEVVDRAALVQELKPDSLDAFDAIVFCNSDVPPGILDSIPTGARSIFMDPDTPVTDAIPVVAGVNSEQVTGATRVVSPSAAIVMLSHLLAPLRDLGGLEVVAHVLQPASARGKSGLDELFEQTRSIIAMTEERPTEVFGTQLAFNLLPWGGSSTPLSAQLGEVLGTPVEARIQLSQSGVFHCSTAGTFLAIAEDPGIDRLQELLFESPMVEQAEEPELLGPVVAARARKILVGEISPSPVKGYWLWSCVDNLSACADNAVALARL